MIRSELIREILDVIDPKLKKIYAGTIRQMKKRSLELVYDLIVEN